MTKDNSRQKARDILTNYMEAYKHRRTPERYAILDAVFDFKGHFTLKQLAAKLEASNFHVSRATIYNSIKLFIDLRLVIRLNIVGETQYEAFCGSESHIHQVCLNCGKVVELKDKGLADAIGALKMPKFRKEGFALFVYGICGSCQARLSRQARKQEKSKQKDL